ncbi:alanine---tRNA ligase [Chytriomyces confervae]|uniref:Alanine---tRNA ligase n=1 Tax=Chytriomyces confervae TaxID=246404 RepID=A0A507FJ97_9FUNG|nr:alanine---tRNA ligase [Chytriomyces confervae]
MIAQVGNLACQKDSYRKTLEATVVSIEKSTDGSSLDVVLSDTVLFPTGGGQWNDLGSISGLKVTDVFRKGMDPVHRVVAPAADSPQQALQVGQVVTAEVDWTRRFDVMQQHSGQHLLSAIAGRDFGLETVAWALGEDKSCIEVDLSQRKAPTEAELAALEEAVNSAIRKSLPFSVHVSDSVSDGGAPSKLPSDLAGGVIRHIRIGELDDNPCCGTHVSSTAELQCLKLLHTEKVRGKNMRLYFLFGNRVLSTLHACVSRDRAIGAQLCAGPDAFTEKIGLLQSSLKTLTKVNKTQLKELAEAAAKRMAAFADNLGENSGVLVLAHHRDDADAEFLTILSKAASEKCPGAVFIFSIGAMNEGGAGLVVGPAGKEVEAVWKQFSIAMGSSMKGGGKGGRYQAKASSWLNRKAALEVVGASDFEIEALALNLAQLQNLVKRDAQSYKDEFKQQLRHWTASLAVFALDPAGGGETSGSNLGELISFLSHTVSCYPKDAAAVEFPEQLINLLQTSGQTLKPELRRSMVQALILLRNKDSISVTKTMPLFFSLFRVHDKELRKLLHSHIVADIKNANVKAKNNKLNKTLQNFMYTMLKDDHEIAARKSLEVMIELYTKNIWNDAKTVNVISEAVFSPHAKLASTAIHFFLGTHDEKKNEDDEDEGIDMESIRHKMQINKKKGSKSNMLEKAMATVKRKQRQKERAEVFNFSALHLLHSAQDFTDKLFARLKQITSNSNSFRYELRLAFINLISRLIGIHKLIILPFYTYLTPYLTPHQRQVPKLLAYTAQASHDLVPPETMQPVVQQIADKFIWTNAATEVVVAGLNATREICMRCPLAMSEDLLGSVIEDYKNHRDKGSAMALRALLSLYREVNPAMLKKKHRGKGASMNMAEFKAPSYGSVNVMDMIDGADLLLEEEEHMRNGGDADTSEPGDGWEGWEVASDSDDDEEDSKRKANAKAIVEVLDGDDDDDAEGWVDSDEDDEGGDDDGDEDDEEDEEDDEDEEKEKKAGPKQQKLAKQDARRNLEKKLETSPAKKQKVISSLTERILTDEDFLKMRELSANRKAEVMSGVRKSRVQELMDEDDEENGEAADRDVVDVRRITSGVKRKMTYQERVEHIQEGREGRDKFGSRMGQKKAEHGGSTTNREKSKKTKAFQMIAHKRSVVGKAKRSLREKQQVLRNHITKQKKKGF